jgi:hypothetical protein
VSISASRVKYHVDPHQCPKTCLRCWPSPDRSCTTGRHSPDTM